jgi:hypothetical protein
MPTIIKRRNTMKNVLAMMMVICLTLPVNAAVTKSARLNTHKPHVTVEIANKPAKDEDKFLWTSKQITKSILIPFFTVMLANWIFYQYAQSNAQQISVEDSE